MIDYRRASKEKANEDFLRRQGISRIITAPYQEEIVKTEKLFLIICEGQNTEPLYFKSFPVAATTVMVEGGCNSKTALVNYALQLKEKPENIDREIWCVYDYDRKPDEYATQPEDFNNSIAMAEANGLKVAWSNDAFELWFLLHYKQIDTALTRHEIYPKLAELWGLNSFHNVAKTPAFCKGIYNRLATESIMQELAIRRARTLHQVYQSRTDYANHCPCTTVYLLVKELNKNLKA